MKIANVHETEAWFQVLQTGKHAQTAVMTVERGGQSCEELNVHEKSDQVLFVVKGEVEGEVGGQQCRLKAGDVCLVPAGTEHRFANAGAARAMTFNVYSPPEYGAHEQG